MGTPSTNGGDKGIEMKKNNETPTGETGLLTSLPPLLESGKCSTPLVVTIVLIVCLHISAPSFVDLTFLLIYVCAIFFDQRMILCRHSHQQGNEIACHGGRRGRLQTDVVFNYTTRHFVWRSW